MKFRAALIAAFASMIGCGDNSNECGPGTTAVDGVCTPSSMGATCSDGTILDTMTGSCVVDPNACQDGTVLVGGHCVDPGHVTADLEEAPEPNGLGLFGEDSSNPAGLIALKPVGQHFVVHGKIIPFEDADSNGQIDPDIDTYILDVSAPSLITVSADGLHGLAAGFLSVAAVDQSSPLFSWERIGANLTGDMSKRQIYLPAAGTYAVAVTDSRTLILNSSAAAGAASGAADFEYYITIDATTLPAPLALPVTANQATSTGTLTPGEPKFFTVPMGTGFNNITLDDDGANYTESIVVANTRGGAVTVKAVGDGNPATPTPATASAFGVQAGDSTLVVADAVVDYSTMPTNYTLTIDTKDAGALSTTGGNVIQPADTTNFSVFSYDSATNNEFTGMNVVFDTDVSGVVVDENLFVFSYFTYDPFFGFGFGDTFNTYKGVLREPLKGRYYFLVFDPTGAATAIQATSTYAPLTPVVVTEGTVTGSQAVSATYGTNLFTYNAGTDPWQTFKASNTVSSRFYVPADAVGRLSPLGADSTCNIDADNDFCTADSTPLWAPALTTTPAGRILLDDGTTNYVVVARPAAAFTLDFEPRVHTDLAPTAGGAAVTDHGTLDLTTTLKRYLIKTAAGNRLTVDVTPSNAGTDAVIKQLDVTETVTATINNAVGNGAEHLQTIQSGNGWTAITVSAQVAAAGQAFDLSATALAGITYTKSAGTTAYADACTGGTTVTMSDPDEGRSTTTINSPTGFKLFGLASPAFRVFSNGFISFDTNLACPTATSCFFSSSDLPDGNNPNAIIAPFWGDLVLTSACVKTAGTKVIVQWNGTHYQETGLVAVQAIIDGATNTIEFVYGPTQDAANDGSEDTIGIESAGGVSAYKIGFDQAVVTPASAILLTPN